MRTRSRIYRISEKALALLLASTLVFVSVFTSSYAEADNASAADGTRSGYSGLTDTADIVELGADATLIESPLEHINEAKEEPARSEAPKNPPEPSTERGENGEGSPTSQPMAAWTDGEVTIGTVRYKHYANGEASLYYGAKVSGNFTVPTRIQDARGEWYTVTAIGSYTVTGGQTKGAFGGNMGLTGISFESDSQLRSIDAYAFNACYNLGGSTIILPDTVTDIGSLAFSVADGSFGSGAIAKLKHPHVVKASGELPDLNVGSQIPQPSDLIYEDLVDSSKDNVTLYKSARWTNDELTEAEIRIDFGKEPNYSGKVDFLFVLDHSPSMHDAATYHDDNDESHLYPRSMLTNDIVYDISKKLLEENQKGYDNRVAMTAFDNNVLWSMPFTNDSAVVQETLYTHPLTSMDKTNYGAGLQGAIKLINQRTDASRQVAVVFLSDGLPNTGYGTSEARSLRTMGVKVYPVSVFGDALSALRAISYDGRTAYNAASTDDFETIITEVVEDIIEQPQTLQLDLEDVLGTDFDLLTGTNADIETSQNGGSVQIQGKTLTWDLTGCAPNALHTVKIKVKIDDDQALELHGSLATNASLEVSDGSTTTTGQPRLERYLVEHEFVNGSDPSQDLPVEVLALLPANTGGYRNGDAVSPTDVSEKRVKSADGAIWEFGNWDRDNDAINNANSLFKGSWNRIGAELLFAKKNVDQEALPGAVFSVYRWAGSLPPSDDEYVTESTIGSAKWVAEAETIVTELTPAPFAFSNPGIYQLAETTSPAGYHKPKTQWRFTINADFSVDDVLTISQGDSIVAEDFTPVQSGGATVWTLINHRQGTFEFYKVSGVLFETDDDAQYPLAGGEFELYLWTGSDPPQSEKLVTHDAVQSGEWKLAGTAVSGGVGLVSFDIPVEQGWIYQLVEKTAPSNHTLPSGQWRISFKDDGTVDTDAIHLVPGDFGTVPPKLEIAESGPLQGELILVNIPTYRYPEAGGFGTRLFELAGGTLILFAALGFSSLLVWNRRRSHI